MNWFMPINDRIVINKWYKSPPFAYIFIILNMLLHSNIDHREQPKDKVI